MTTASRFSREIVSSTPVIDPRHSVFINCPFDDEYKPVMHAIVFATVCCGFIPRSALESGNVAVPRIERIVRTLFSSKYSIHDLSRCRGEGSELLARFNMPLELGIAMACRFANHEHQSESQHDWLALVPKGHLYMKFVSDLAGYDAKEYELSPPKVVPAVMSWLATRPDAMSTTTPKRVIKSLPRFQAACEALAVEWGGDVPWRDIVLAAHDAVPAEPA